MNQLLQKNSFTNKKWIAYLLACAFAMAGLPSQAWSLGGSDDADTKDKPLAEIDWQLPAPPATENMLPFFVSATTRQSFAIDAKSLTVDTDGVVRYTLVGTSSAGAKNISYEGIRCSSFERRLYAVGHADGTWARARSSEWQPIAATGASLQYAELAQNYFCNSGLTAGKADQIINAIRYHRSDSKKM